MGSISQRAKISYVIVTDKQRVSQCKSLWRYWQPILRQNMVFLWSGAIKEFKCVSAKSIVFGVRIWPRFKISTGVLSKSCLACCSLLREFAKLRTKTYDGCSNWNWEFFGCGYVVSLGCFVGHMLLVVQKLVMNYNLMKLGQMNLWLLLGCGTSICRK